MTTALVIIDMQEGMADRMRAGREQANPRAEENTAALLALFRARGLPVIHVFHDDAHPDSPFRKGLPSAEPMACARPVAGETVFWKHGSSAFHGTGLEAYLRKQGIDTIVLTGAVAAFCVTSSTRQGSDLGFRILLPGDALIGFDLPAHDGGRLDAQTVLRVTLSLLGADFATLVATDQVASLLPSTVSTAETDA
jgi:nicotinamidase-related amidase